METDLPVIPCYESNNCGQAGNYNCGNTYCDSQNADPPSINPSDDLKCPLGETMGSCYGNNPNFCNGIQSCCDPNIPANELVCNEDQDPTKPVFGPGPNDYLGCNIGDEIGNCSFTNNRAECMEFQKPEDLKNGVGICDEPCWKFGGYQIMKDQCELQIGSDENVCRAMEYYCDWDSKNKQCTLTRDENDLPWVQFPNYEGTVAFSTSNDCTINECINIPSLTDEESGVGTNESRYTVHSSQSAWDSTKQTTYNPTTRIVCVKDSKTDKKVCLTAPRCQAVSSTKECGMLEIDGKSRCNDYFENRFDPPCSEEPSSNLLFMCSRFDVSTTTGDLGSNEEPIFVSKSGYCTWCKGTQYKGEFQGRQDRVDTLIELDKGIIPTVRDPIDWDISPPNRCENYNECEVPGSDEMWNKCMFDVSNGEFGYNYTEFSNETPEKKREILKNQGFCKNIECLTDPTANCNQEEMEIASRQRQYSDHCEEELSNMGSINWGRIMGPNNSETAACQYRYNWYNICNVDTGQGENYLCTWCPSNQCKIGSKEEICSVVAEGENSWNRLPYCDTDSEHGTMTELAKQNAPDQCDCFLPKSSFGKSPIAFIDPEYYFEVEDLVMVSSGLSVAILAGILVSGL
jgi:hypothetical protein